MNNNILAGGAVAGVLIGFWNRIKEVFHKCVNLIVVNAELDETLALFVYAHLRQLCSINKFNDKRFGAMWCYIEPERRWGFTGFEDVSSDNIIFWKGWKPILFKKASLNTTAFGTTGVMQNRISFVRGMFNLDSIISGGIALHNRIHEDRENYTRHFIKVVSGDRGRTMDQLAAVQVQGANPAAYSSIFDKYPIIANNAVYRFVNWENRNIKKSETPRIKHPLDWMALPPEAYNIVDEIKKWKENKEFFLSKGIDWKRGLLLHGKPGTGKSSLVRAISQELDLPLVIFDLNSMTNKNFMHEWDHAQKDAPCIVLIEDIDNVFNGREPVNPSPDALSFDCFLNCLSGAQRVNGIFVVITTNHIEKLDRAIGVADSNGESSRPGRIDRCLELGLPNTENRTKIANKILCDCKHRIAAAVADTDGMTGAQCENKYIEIALEEFWKCP